MSDSTRDELIDTKLALVEQRIETRLVGIDAKIDRVLDRVESSLEASREAKRAAEAAKSSAGDIKWNILFTALGVLAVLVAAYALWAQGVEMMGTLLSAKHELTDVTPLPQSPPSTGPEKRQ